MDAAEPERRHTTTGEKIRTARDIVALVAIGGAALVWAFSQAFGNVPGPSERLTKAEQRIQALEANARPMMFMVCSLFAEKYPGAVPSECPKRP